MAEKTGKRGGRAAGTPNKIGALAKDNIIAVFNRLGGTAGMARWAEKNQTEFYKLYARLIPVQMEGTGEDGKLIIQVVRYTDADDTASP